MSTRLTTIAQARRFVQKVKVCTVFPTDKAPHTSLFEHVDLPDKQPGEKGWGKKIEAVWTWKTRLPAEYPDEIYYGKIKGGFAVLMDMRYMAGTHFPQAYRDVRTLSALTQTINEMVSAEPWDTTTLRNLVMEETGCSKSQFDTALKNLQITMNIVRLNDPKVEQDTWVPFRELYLDVWQRHVESS